MAPGEVAASASLRIEVLYSPRSACTEAIHMSLPPGSTVAQALRDSGVYERHPELQADACRCGVWGRACEPGQVLRDRDRVELYRPLLVEPKEARRQRYAEHLQRHGGRKRVPPRR